MNKEKKPVEYYLRSTWQAIVRMYNEQASRYDSTMIMAFTLLSLDPKQGIPSTTLGPRMGMEPTSLSRTLKNLEDKGYIYREINPEDGRSVLIKLTEEGLKMRDTSKEHVLSFNSEIEKLIPENNMKIFINVLEKIHQITNEFNYTNQQKKLKIK